MDPEDCRDEIVFDDQKNPDSPGDTPEDLDSLWIDEGGEG